MASRVGAYGPWLDVESRDKAHTPLAMLATGAGTYLFTRPPAQSKWVRTVAQGKSSLITSDRSGRVDFAGVAA